MSVFEADLLRLSLQLRRKRENESRTVLPQEPNLLLEIEEPIRANA
jgi:hypothetical protein